MSREKTLREILNHKAVAVLRLNDSTHALPAIEAIVTGGVRCVEVTLTTPNALDIIRQAAAQPHCIVGAGSVLNARAAAQCSEAGARFIVSPVMKPEIIHAAHSANVVAMAGAFTPSEMLAAHEAGADVVKVFPAEFVSPAYFKAVLTPMPHLRLMPTGGVTLTNASEWLRAGACAIGVGSALCDAKLVDAQQFAQLTENARMLLHLIKNFEEET